MIRRRRTRLNTVCKYQLLYEPKHCEKTYRLIYAPNHHETITKTCIYNFDPLKPNFYIVKLGFTGVYSIFLISTQKHRLWVLVRIASTSTHNLCFEQKYENYQFFFLSENFHFLVVVFSVYLKRHVFVMRRL